MIPFPAKDISLRKRILVPLFFASSVLLGFVGYLTNQQIKEQLRENVSLRSQLAANSVSYAIDTVTTQGALHRYVSSIGAQPEVEVLVVAGGKPLRVIATTRHKWRDKLVEDIDDHFVREELIQASNAKSSKRFIDKETQKSFYTEPTPMGMLAPNEGLGSDGAILVALSHQYFNQQLTSQVISKLFYYGLSIILITAITYFLLSTRVLKPIFSIARAVDQPHQNTPPKISRDLFPDEIGGLAKALEDAFEKKIESNRQANAYANALKFQKNALDQHAIVSEADAKGRITYANNNFCKISGFSREELTGQDHRILNSGYHVENYFKSMYQSLQTEGHWRGEIRNKAKDGSLYWVNSSIIAFKNDKEEIERYVSIREDITLRKQAELELIQAHEKIAQSLESENAARLEAERATLAKSQFLATMSHEIRTPMNGLIGVLHLLEDGLSAEKSKLINTAQNSAEDLLVLINDILDFSKIEAGKMDLEHLVFDACELVEEVCELHAATAHEKGLEIASVCHPQRCFRTMGDPHRIRQIASNLVGNAIKFTQEGEVAVELRFSGTNDEISALRFEVRDTGIGVAKETQEQLFTSFSQANRSTTRKFGGTGLGLSICKSLVELMGGQIGVHSEPGNGSTFWFEIPFEAATSPQPKQASLDLSGKRALIIDSNASVRKQIGNWLTHWNCDVADSAIYTEETICENARSYDFVFIDERRLAVHQNEWETAIKDEGAFGRATPILLHRYSESLLKGELTNACSHIRKPISVSQLRESLQESKTIKATEPKIEAPKENYHSKRVLLVDDNLTNRMIATELFKKLHGIQPDTANDGIEALRMLRKDAYDLVFMDCMMPEMDGYDATRALRNGDAGEQNQNAPVIALTANAMSGDREKCEASGMSDYLTKPIRPKAITDVLKRWLN